MVKKWFPTHVAYMVDYAHEHVRHKTFVNLSQATKEKNPAKSFLM